MLRFFSPLTQVIAAHLDHLSSRQAFDPFFGSPASDIPFNSCQLSK
jgi:hypothetical protein